MIEFTNDNENLYKDTLLCNREFNHFKKRKKIMLNKEITIWGIRAGKKDDAAPLFFKKNVIALGWGEMGDLSKIAADRESFKAKLIATYPETKPAAVPVVAGQPFRFIHVLKIGDMVVYPSKSDRQVYLGLIDGEYRYKPQLSEKYPNTRSVTWKKALPRTSFTQRAVYEIGSAMSFFLIKNNADEFLSFIEDIANSNLNKVEKR